MSKQETTEQKFIAKYNALCEKYRFRISVIPVFMARDDGTWSVVLQSRLEKLPPKEDMPHIL